MDVMGVMAGVVDGLVERARKAGFGSAVSLISATAFSMSVISVKRAQGRWYDAVSMGVAVREIPPNRASRVGVLMLRYRDGDVLVLGAGCAD